MFTFDVTERTSYAMEKPEVVPQDVARNEDFQMSLIVPFGQSKYL
jgi:hypothetical protein